MKPLPILASTVLIASALSYAYWLQTDKIPGIDNANATSITAEQNSTSSAGMPTNRDEFKEMVKDAIMEDPEMIMHAIRKLRQIQEEDSKRASAEAFEKNRESLINDTTSPSVGDPKTADVTVIEFFDYHCGYCKRVLPTVAQLVEEDPKVRVIFREYPILSEESVLASRAALAVNRLAPDKYFEYHTALMNNTGKYTPNTLLKLAEKIGVDPEVLKVEMDKPEITDILEQNRLVAQELGVRGTPAIFVGDKMLPGAIPYGTLKRIVGEVRSSKQAETEAEKN